MRTLRNLTDKGMMLFFLLMASFATLQAQSVEYEPVSASTKTQGYWTFGLNGGFSNQQGDVKSSIQGWGAGLTLAKNVFYQPNAPLSFDLRGRALYSQTYGIDTKRFYGIANNIALNGKDERNLLNESLLNYSKPRGNGYVFMNNRTNMGELSLEGVLSFNKLRERTGVVLSLYGGLGLDWYQTRMDQSDENGIYNYSGIDTTASRSQIKTDLRNLRDGIYETTADGFDNRIGKFAFMPAAGVELGYAFTPYFYASLGHKVTFTNSDAWDAQQWNSAAKATGNNDLHHYTYLQLAWELREKKVELPIIEITDPSKSPYTTKEAAYTVKGNIKNVRGAWDVTYLVNGVPAPFDFFNQKEFSALTRLKGGKNEIYVKATNKAGSDEKTIIIYYDEPERRLEAPTVKITDPRGNLNTTNVVSNTVRAIVNNVEDKSYIDILVNNLPQNNFVYNTTTKEVIATVQLTEGKNSITVKAENKGGRASDEIQIEYIKDKVVIEPPVQTVPTPPAPTMQAPYVSVKAECQVSAGNYLSTCKGIISATIQNVTSRNDIEFYLDGRSSNEFSFDAYTQKLTSTLSFDCGSHTVIVRAKNQAGVTEGKATIDCSANTNNTQIPNTNPAPPQERRDRPVITITNPNRSGQSTSDLTTTISATVVNVDTKNDITVYFNGFRTGNFDYNTYSKVLTMRVSLKEGENQVRIQAKNTMGSDEQSTSIRRYVENTPTQSPSPSRPTPLPPNMPTRVLPDVRINTPRNNSTQSTQNVTLEAIVTNVDYKSDIEVLLNRQNIDFDFDRTRGTVRSNVRLQEGGNTIQVAVRNRDGNDNESVNVRYEILRTPPAITLNNLSSSSTTTVTKRDFTVKARITNITNRDGVRFTINGNENNNFSLNNGTFESNITLNEGTNSVVISANNKDGRDEKRSNIVYRIPALPEVSITSHRSGDVVNTENITINAAIKNVAQKKDIKYYVNGRSSLDFAFSGSTFNGGAFLKEGTNDIKIVVSNPDGNKETSVSVTYRKNNGTKPSGKIGTDGEIPSLNNPPVVTIESLSEPVLNPRELDKAKSTLIANVKNVTNKERITLMVNGQQITDFKFDAKSGLVQYTFDLQKGNNTVRVFALNDDGTDEKTKTIKF